MQARTSLRSDSDTLDIEHVFSEGKALHGEIGVNFSRFRERILDITSAGGIPNRSPTDPTVAARNGADLYLAMACAAGNEEGWERFIVCYKMYIFDVAAFASRSKTLADDVTSQTLLHLFLPDGSGRRRIDRYDGRSSLATWLRSIVIRKAADEVNLKFNSMEPLKETLARVASDELRQIEAHHRARRYGSAVEESLRDACANLAEDERRLLLMRYDQELQLTRIAQEFGVSISTISRRIIRAQDKIGIQIATHLSSRLHFGTHAINECVQDALDNPSHSILGHLRASKRQTNPARGNISNLNP